MKNPRVLIAKPGLDGHDRGAKTVAHALKAAGCEVLYTGLHKTPEQIVELARDREVDVVGLSVLSGAHLPICEEVVAKMKEAGLGHLPLMVGGVIPEGDVPKLQAMGIEGIFPTRAAYEDIVAFVKEKAND